MPKSIKKLTNKINSENDDYNKIENLINDNPPIVTGKAIDVLKARNNSKKMLGVHCSASG